MVCKYANVFVSCYFHSRVQLDLSIDQRHPVINPVTLYYPKIMEVFLHNNENVPKLQKAYLLRFLLDNFTHSPFLASTVHYLGVSEMFCIILIRSSVSTDHGKNKIRT